MFYGFGDTDFDGPHRNLQLIGYLLVLHFVYSTHLECDFLFRGQLFYRLLQFGIKFGKQDVFFGIVDSQSALSDDKIGMLVYYLVVLYFVEATVPDRSQEVGFERFDLDTLPVVPDVKEYILNDVFADFLVLYDCSTV